VIFRKAHRSESASDLDARDRRKRGRDGGSEPGWSGLQPPESAPTDPTGAGSAPARTMVAGDAVGEPSRLGPFDAAEMDHEDDVGRVDLGGLKIRVFDDIELRLQVDEATQQVVAALFVQGDSALELRAFAAPRSTSLWDEIRREIAVETTRRGGVVTEGSGPYGAEIKVVVPTQAPDGRQTSQASRIVGVDGPRWFLRGTLIGRAAADADVAGPLLAAMSQVVVVRGKAPMAPRDMIPLKLPEGVRTAPES
jgi:Protein of unknown function (DUF3710)